jgi:small subunit ribosomal protein S20
MPISLSAKKSFRKSVKNQKVNSLTRKVTKKAIKDYLAKPSTELLKKTYSVVDKAVKGGVFHKNKASRIKARLSRRLAGVEEKKTVSKKTAKTMK